MKQLYCKAFTKQALNDFIQETRRQYYTTHKDATELIKNIGKVMAYTEAAWAMNKITKEEAIAVIKEAQDTLEEITC